MAKLTLKTGTRKTTITRIAVRQALKAKSTLPSSPSEKSSKSTGSKKK